MKRNEAAKLHVGSIINVSWIDAPDEVGIIAERYLVKGKVTGFNVLVKSGLCDVEFGQITGVAETSLNWEHFEDALAQQEGNICCERQRFMKRAAKRYRKAA